MTTTGTNLLGLRYRCAWEHSDATIKALPVDAHGYVPWWPRPDVKLFNIMVHLLTETSRHAGHADILREPTPRRGGDGRPGQATHGHGHDKVCWDNHRARIEQAARAADPTKA